RLKKLPVDELGHRPADRGSKGSQPIGLWQIRSAGGTGMMTENGISSLDAVLATMAVAGTPIGITSATAGHYGEAVVSLGCAALGGAEARARLDRYGPNELVPPERGHGVWGWLVRAVVDPMSLLLLVAGGTYLLLGEYLDASITLGALIPITAVSIVLEGRAE